MQKEPKQHVINSLKKKSIGDIVETVLKKKKGQKKRKVLRSYKCEPISVFL